MTASRARELAEFLELRARTPEEVATRGAYLDLLAPAPGERVLDAGCGSGAVTRELARRVAPGGRVVGLDPNPGLLAAARERAEQEGLGEVLEWRPGDVRALPCADAEFDAVVCATVLVHVPDDDGGGRAVRELVRAVRPGGRVGVLEPDPEVFLLAHPDRALTRRIVGGAADYGFVNAGVARALPGLLAAAGLAGVRARAFTALDRDPAGFCARTARVRAEMAVQAGAVPAASRDRWLATLADEEAAGRFLGANTYVFAWGVRPGGP
jgi:SAM-dependent methyltransferase